MPRGAWLASDEIERNVLCLLVTARLEARFRETHLRPGQLSVQPSIDAHVDQRLERAHMPRMEGEKPLDGGGRPREVATPRFGLGDRLDAGELVRHSRRLLRWCKDGAATSVAIAGGGSTAIAAGVTGG
jgi:hypothetical protein